MLVFGREEVTCSWNGLDEPASTLQLPSKLAHVRVERILEWVDLLVAEEARQFISRNDGAGGSYQAFQNAELNRGKIHRYSVANYFVGSQVKANAVAFQNFRRQ